MKAGSFFLAAWRHFRLCLRLNLRSKQALAYGYLMPVIFLLAFASIFRGDTPALQHQMGQLLTISLLGGACFGLPTALVAERERGVWRRYRLLPVPPGSLLGGVLLARLVFVGSASALQIALARLAYGTPLPLHPVALGVAFLVVAFAFLGLGLLVAAVADDVPAVQALGQCLFLPMILIGGVGVPLAVLPAWAQKCAGFMPGRYAVEVLQRTLSEPGGLHGAGFALLALLIIGGVAGFAGLKLFRWDAGHRMPRSDRPWVLLGFSAWIAVGLAASATGRLPLVGVAAVSSESITDEQLATINYDDLPGDNELATRLAPPFQSDSARAQIGDFPARLKSWAPGHVSDSVQAARNLLSVAALADVAADPKEGEIARAIFDELQVRHKSARLRQILGWIVLHPDEGDVVSQAPELGQSRRPAATVVRERSALYAKKFLGRLVGQLHD